MFRYKIISIFKDSISAAPQGLGGIGIGGLGGMGGLGGIEMGGLGGMGGMGGDMELFIQLGNRQTNGRTD